MSLVPQPLMKSYPALPSIFVVNSASIFDGAARPIAEIIEPGPQHVGFDAMSLGQVRDVAADPGCLASSAAARYLAAAAKTR